MTTPNDTEMKVYDQLMEVRRCIDALKDIYQNIPDDDRYASAIGIITERLELEFSNLTPVALTACREMLIDDGTSTNGNAVNEEIQA